MLHKPAGMDVYATLRLQIRWFCYPRVPVTHCSSKTFLTTATKQNKLRLLNCGCCPLLPYKSGVLIIVKTRRNLIQLCLLGMTLLLPAVVQAQFTFTTNNGAITITGYTGSNGVVTIPGTIADLPVTSIGDWAFYSTDVTNILIPDSVTNIGDGAFFDCESLTNVTVGSSVTDIGDWTFAFCSSLTSVNFRGNTPNLGGADVFYGNLATVYYLSGATNWGPMFDGHPAVLWNPPVPFIYTINNDTITITEYTGSNGVVTIPGTINFLPVASIGDYSFYYDTDLVSVMIPCSVNSIGEGAFLNCFSLDSVSMVNGLTSIGGDAFTDTSLNSVMIPASVTNIEEGAFDGCTSMTAITVDEQNLFYSSTNGVLFDNTQTTLVKYPDGLDGSYTIPTNVISIGGNAFADCKLTSIAIPNSVTSIADNTFFGCINLTNIIIPDSVTNIGFGAFTTCTGLTNVMIGNNVTSVGQSAFADCESLTSITIPSSVTSIEGYAFESCFGLTSIYFKGNSPDFGPYVFDGANDLTLYYLLGTSGWGSDFAGRPIKLWLPLVQTSDASFGVQTNQFGFNISWASDQTVVVEACTNLANPDWQPVQTNTLTTGSAYFSDPEWTNYPNRFYRLRSL